MNLSRKHEITPKDSFSLIIVGQGPQLATQNGLKE